MLLNRRHFAAAAVASLMPLGSARAQALDTARIFT